MAQLETSSLNMKFSLSVLVAAVCFSVSPGNAASIVDAFVNGTRILDPPSVTYYPINGTATQETIISAMSALLGDMTDGLRFQSANSARAVYTSIRHLEQGVEHAVSEIQAGVNTSFDFVLPDLAKCYRNFSAAVKGGLKHTKHFGSQGSSRVGAGQQRDIRIWTLDEAFVHLPETVAPDLQRLNDWFVNFAYIGVSNVTAEIPAIMEDLRVQSLYPFTAKAMVKAYQLQQNYDQLLQEHTSPDIYSDYAAARDELLSLEIE